MTDENSERSVGGTTAVAQRWGASCFLASQPVHVNPASPSRRVPGEEIPWCGIKMRLGRKIKAADFVTDDLSLLSSSAAMKKFKCFALPLPVPPNLPQKKSNLIFFFLFCWWQQHQACYISAMIYSRTSWLLTTYGSFVWVCLLGCLITWSACCLCDGHTGGCWNSWMMLCLHQPSSWYSSTLAWP